LSALYEIVLRTGDGEELQSTDKPMKVGDTFVVADQSWIVEADEPAAGEGTHRLICGKNAVSPDDAEGSVSAADAEDSSATGVIRIHLSNDDQGRHLFQALRGHCEVELIPGSEGTSLAISSSADSGSRGVLRRLDSWLREFGVESVTIELDGQTYVMRRA
jgi:hypothetical protein